MKRVRLGRIHAHAVSAMEALDAVGRLIAEGKGGYIVTPNVDHVVQAERSDDLAAAYQDASLSLVDGQPLLWLSRLMKDPLPEKISGSDFVPLLMERAAREGWRVLFLGAAEGVGAKAADVLREKHPTLQIVAVESPVFGFDQDPAECERVLERVRAARADLVVMALGCPKQELLMHRWKPAIAPAVAIGSGATLDFIAGNIPRAPSWMSRYGFEWLFRLAREPRRLAHRYLVRDPQIVGVAWRMMRLTPQAGADEQAQRKS
ncbi:MAG TPA: WecB/TagA/CpsF family glycosyltransferase [Polyangiales bacterium]|nr:WecB/TagA/CpsF family glycosyltransferase [Polyangiales bacterium]